MQATAWGTGKVWDPRYCTLGDLPAHSPADVQTPRLVHHYWQQMDPDWLLEQLRAGHPPHRLALRARWEQVADERAVAALRAHEPFVVEPLLDRGSVDVLIALGARVDVHTEDVCRLLVGEEVWTVQRSDPLTWVRTPQGVRGYVRVREMLPSWLAALVGSTLVGGAALPESAVRTEVVRHYGRARIWGVVDGQTGRRELAECSKAHEADAALFQRTVGRTVAEVAAAYGVGLRPAVTSDLPAVLEGEAVAKEARRQEVPVRPVSRWARLLARWAGRVKR